MKYLIFIIFFFSCADKNFIVFSIDGEKLNDDIYDTGNISINKFDLFFSKNDINRDYIEVNIIATNSQIHEELLSSLSKKTKGSAISLRLHVPSTNLPS